MDKNAIKKFAVWARRKLLEDIKYQASLLGITEKGIGKALPQSTMEEEYYDIGTKNPYVIQGKQIAQRQSLVNAINGKAQDADYQTAYNIIIEEVAYTWFNRLIAVRFMEVNDYLPCKIRVLSAADGRQEPDIVQNPFDARLDFTEQETAAIVQLQNDHEYNKLFQYLFIKVCNDLSKPLPQLFEHQDDYTELLLNISYIDEDGLVYKLVHDIAEKDFNVNSPDGQVEIIGWLYQYYNTEPKDQTFALLKKNVKVTKDTLPFATQLFTPDWIVQYMVQNSLGRLWIEGHPNDELKQGWRYYLDDPEQEEAVNAELAKIKAEYFLVTPEKIKIIDPCMGSGHILIYAFDLLMQIYMNQGYTEKDAVISILQHNLYGLDIDKRAYQLAYFSVMMKARQYYKLILRKNVQCNLYTVPESNKLLHKQDQLKYFGAGMDDFSRNIALTEVRGLLDDFKDAKEYGSLINVQNYNWELLQQFAADFDISTEPNLFATYNIETTQRQLQEIVTVGQILATKYSVVCTNPPYMGASNMGAKLSDFVRAKYPDSKSDLFAVFIEFCINLTKKNFYTSMITQQSWMFLSSFEKLRAKILQNNIINMVHLGARAFEKIGGEVVQPTSFVIRKNKIMDYQATYCRLIEPTTQQGKEDMFLTGDHRYTAPQNNFFKIPGSCLAYWGSEKVLDAYLYPNMNHVAQPRHGLATSDNDRFLKLWHEIDINTGSLQERCQYQKKWFPISKGGSFRRWYGNLEWVINYENNGKEIKDYAISIYRCASRTIQNTQFYFKEGLTWSALASGGFSVRWHEKGALFGSGGYCAFVEENLRFYILALLNSKVTGAFIAFVSPTLNFEVGHIKTIPVVQIDWIDYISEIARHNVKFSHNDWDSFETSWDFSKHPLIKANCTVAEAYAVWKQECEERFTQLKANEEELNRIFIDIYGLQEELTPDVADKDVTVYRIFDNKEAVPASMQGSKYVLTKSDVIKSLLSYAVGCMFGRYSLDVDGLAYAGGEWDDSKYQTFIPDADNVIPITDEDYFEDDLVGRFISWLKVVYGEENLEENLRFIAEALNTKGDTPRQKIRNYFIKDFFKDHCKIYQKRPIYWLYDSGKQDGFKALIYMHRYTKDTTGTVRAEYLEKILRVYESEISRMLNIMETGAVREAAKAETRLGKLQKQLKECRDYDEKVGHLALSDISIDLDDGVKVNYEKVQKDNNGEFLQILAKI